MKPVVIGIMVFIALWSYFQPSLIEFHIVPRAPASCPDPDVRPLAPERGGFYCHEADVIPA